MSTCVQVLAQGSKEVSISCPGHVAVLQLAPNLAPLQTMGRHGAAALLEAAQARGRASNGRLRVLTHCNTGSLATAAYGTALGVIRALHEQGRLEHAYCCETRPYNQASGRAGGWEGKLQDSLGTSANYSGWDPSVCSLLLLYVCGRHAPHHR